jgi:hypothetical protein
MVSLRTSVAAFVLLASLLGLGVGCDSGGGAMTILDVQPRKGSASGGQRIAILGKNFRTDIGYTVYFGAKKSPAVTIIDPQTLVVETPLMDNAGPVDITLRADNGDAFKIAAAFAYEDGASMGAPKGNLKF